MCILSLERPWRSEVLYQWSVAAKVASSARVRHSCSRTTLLSNLRKPDCSSSVCSGEPQEPSDEGSDLEDADDSKEPSAEGTDLEDAEDSKEPSAKDSDLEDADKSKEPSAKDSDLEDETMGEKSSRERSLLD